MPDHTIRAATAGDYDAIAAVADGWWGRPVVRSLPRLFLIHFHRTSLVTERDGVLSAFLVGFHSPAGAYIHFVGVDPQWRSAGLARAMYERFFDEAKAAGCARVTALTAPVNTGSMAFHRRLGFSVSEPVRDYDAPDLPRVLFSRDL